MIHFVRVLRNIRYYRGDMFCQHSIHEFNKIIYNYEYVSRIKRLSPSQIGIDNLKYFGLFVPTFWINNRKVELLKRQMGDSIFMNNNQYFHILINAILNE